MPSPRINLPEDAPGLLNEAMRRWLDGTPVPSREVFLSTFGTAYINYRIRCDAFYGFDAGAIDIFSQQRRQRRHFIDKYGFSIPISEAIDALRKYSPLLEIGAGSGYWSRLMRNEGIDVVATDPSCDAFYGFDVGKHFPVEPLPGKTAVRHYPRRNVFCSWPSLKHTWLRQAARAMRPGRTLIVVREDSTADERTWDYIEGTFRHVENIEIPCWSGTHDWIEIWIKRGRTNWTYVS